MKKNKKSWILIFLAIIFLMTLIYGGFSGRTVLVEKTTVIRGDFDLTIKSDGIIRSKERFIVPAFADGDIKRVFLKVGDLIQKGQSVAELLWDDRYQSVKSPIRGVVSKVFRESAGPIRRGEPIVEVVDPENLEMMVELLTSDATQIKVGNPFLVSSWGGVIPLEGEVVRVSKAGFSKTSALGVEEEKTEVTGNFKKITKEVLSKIGDNYHVDVSIKVAQYKNVLKIPSGSIFRSGKDWAVYKVVDGRAREANIYFENRNNEEVMVESGLREGDVLINFPGDLVKDGTKIKSQ